MTNLKPILVLPNQTSIFHPTNTTALVSILHKVCNILKLRRLELVNGPKGVVCDYHCDDLHITELRSYGANSPSRVIIDLMDNTMPIELSAEFKIEGDPNDVDLKRPGPYAPSEISEKIIAAVQAMTFHLDNEHPICNVLPEPVSPHKFIPILSEHVATLIRARHREPKRLTITDGTNVSWRSGLHDVSYGAQYDHAGEDGWPVEDGIFALLPAIACVKSDTDRWKIDMHLLSSEGSESPIDAMNSVDFVNRLHDAIQSGKTS